MHDVATTDMTTIESPRRPRTLAFDKGQTYQLSNTAPRLFQRSPRVSSHRTRPWGNPNQPKFHRQPILFLLTTILPRSLRTSPSLIPMVRPFSITLPNVDQTGTVPIDGNPLNGQACPKAFEMRFMRNGRRRNQLRHRRHTSWHKPMTPISSRNERLRQRLTRRNGLRKQTR